MFLSPPPLAISPTPTCKVPLAMSQRIIFFDIDGTLLASGGAGQQAMEGALIDEFQIQVPFEGVLTAGRTDFGIVSEIFGRYGIETSEQERHRFRRAYLDRLPDCLKDLSGLVLPGVVELLSRLSDREDLVLALLTGNYSEGAWIKLRHFGLDQYFEFGGFGDSHADRNEVAEAAKAAAESSLSRPVAGEHCCVIGDTPADIHCARAIGATAVAVATGAYGHDDLHEHRPNHLFSDFSDVSRVIDRLTTT